MCPLLISAQLNGLKFDSSRLGLALLQGFFMVSPVISSFADLALSPSIVKALSQVGYEQPSPIQAASIPPLLEGRDLLGIAQTGTGKTAAFALPLLTNVNLSDQSPQVLVLAPTRELTIQVAEAFKKYGQYMKDFHVVPIYGGQDMGGQLRQLQRGVHVIVATPGRMMDHLRRKSINLDKLKTVVLDEADEMLRMGFIDDVEWILEHTPAQRQIALFSATMPAQIKRVADRYLKNPAEVRIESSTTTVESIEQVYVQARNDQKLDALTRILEVETFDGMMIFVRTKNATVELAEKLEARGYSAAALNGDMTQALRERTVANLKKEKIDILVATDVAARGVDVPRITHVVNFDVPYDTDSYVHRIGRTGRAGRNGKAVLFVAPREMYMLRLIEKATRGQILPMKIPSSKEVADQRVSAFKQQIRDVMQAEELPSSFFQGIVSDFCLENACTAEQMAATLAYMMQKARPLQLSETELKNDQFAAGRSQGDDRGRRDDGPRDRKTRGSRDEGRGHRDDDSRGRDDSRPRRDAGRSDSSRDGSREPVDRPERKRRDEGRPARAESDVPMIKYRLEVGKQHQVTPGDIVGAIANEAGLEGQYINNLRMFDDYSTVDLPDGMPDELYRHLQKVKVKSQPINISLYEGGSYSGSDSPSEDRPRPRIRTGQTKGSGPSRDRSSRAAPRDRDSRPRAEGSREGRASEGERPILRKKPAGDRKPASDKPVNDSE
jgi:ATP-dependent RNA helicase DeaD